MTIILLLGYLMFAWGAVVWSMPSIVLEIASLLFLLTSTITTGLPGLFSGILWLIFLTTIALLHITRLRTWIGIRAYHKIKDMMPALSITESDALDAGDTWLEQDIFRGNPDWARLAKIKNNLSEPEQAFLDNETEVLCGMLDEWQIAQDYDLPKKVWSYMKKHGFFGLVIGKEYGGLGFSALAHSDIVMKIASRSGVAAVTVMVPNSLGPGELLNYYGTQAQKDYFLPRLANGREIPCFALTEPEAGSDATSIQSEAVVFTQEIAGKNVLMLRITLNKRWITLAPVATLIGVAVQLKDPDGLLNGVGHPGITCLLIARKTPGLIIGDRHLPADQPFMNGTVQAENIIVSLDSIIGGQEQAGNGWRMLLNCLSIGRAISLPALSTASSGVAYITTGAFARIRRQFNVEIAQFEGVMEKLAEIAGLQYLINATRLLTLAAVDAHQKPSVAGAIAKYFNTELARVVINDALDVHAGRAVVSGPSNYLINLYHGIPIAITVEGANIMSRNLLIFGQGAMACHPYIRAEYQAVLSQDIPAFQKLFWQHVGYFIKNTVKTVAAAWTGGLLIRSPTSVLRREHQCLERLSYAFASLADTALITMAGGLKRKERLSARLADGLSYLYMAMAALRLADEGGADEAVHARWACRYCFYHAQKSLLAFCRNVPFRPLGLILRCLAFPMGQSMRYPSDQLDHQLARLMVQNNTYRTSLLKNLYLSGDPEQPIDRVEHALQGIIQNADLYAKVADLKSLKLSRDGFAEKLKEKVAQGILLPAEMQTLLDVEQSRWQAIQVDAFSFEALRAAGDR